MGRTTLLQDQLKDFIFAGNATITLESKTTGNWYTYKIQQSKAKPTLDYIRRLSGSDNDADYAYIGCVYSDSEYFSPVKPYNAADKELWPKSIFVIAWLFKHIDNCTDLINVYHEGKCCRCGRKLTTPESIQLGIGPECRRMV